MDMPADVTIHNETLAMKGREGRLVAIHPEGYYELVASLGDREHRLLLPIATTVLIASEAEEDWNAAGLEVER